MPSVLTSVLWATLGRQTAVMPLHSKHITATHRCLKLAPSPASAGCLSSLATPSSAQLSKAAVAKESVNREQEHPKGQGFSFRCWLLGDLGSMIHNSNRWDVAGITVHYYRAGKAGLKLREGAVRKYSEQVWVEIVKWWDGRDSRFNDLPFAKKTW